MGPALLGAAGKLVHKVFMTAATPDRPAQLGRTDNLPKAYGRLEPRAAQVQGPTGSGVQAGPNRTVDAPKVRGHLGPRRAGAGPYRVWSSG